MLADRDVLGDVHRQRRLTHARPRRDHDHLAVVQAVRHAIQLDEASRDSGDPAAALPELLDRLERAHDLLLHAGHLAFETILADGEDLLLHFIEEVVHLVLFLVGTPDAFRAGGDDLPQNKFLADDLEVVGHVRGRRHERVEIRDEGAAADRVEHVSITQRLRESNQVDALVRRSKARPATV